MRWTITAPAGFPATEFFPGPEPAAVVRYRQLRDPEGEPDPGQDPPKPSNGVLDALRPAVIDRMTSHDACVRHWDLIEERDSLIQQRAHTRTRLDHLESQRKTVINQRRKGWRERETILAARIGEVQAAIANLDRAIAVSDEALQTTAQAEALAGQRIANEEAGACAGELQGRRRAIYALIEAHDGPLLDELRQIDMQLRDLAHADSVKKSAIQAGREKCRQEAVARRCQEREILTQIQKEKADAEAKEPAVANA